MKLKNNSSIVWKLSKEKFEQVLQNSNSIADSLRKLGLSDRNGNHKTIKSRISKEKINISHMVEKRKIINTKNLKKKSNLKEILKENSNYTNTYHLKNLLFKENLLKNTCYKCGIGPEWNNTPLTLQLDHKNGVRNDNRLENLRLLCPNCHSQTKTYAGKKTKKNKPKCINCLKNITKQSKLQLCSTCYSETNRVVERPSKEDLLNLILRKPFTKIASDFGVSDNAIRKWCKFYNLPHRKTDIKKYKDNFNC